MLTSIQSVWKGILFLSVLLFNFNVDAQQEWKSERRINIVSGLTQALVVKGFNIEGNYIHDRLIFDYSHGFSLDFSGPTVSPELKEQGVAVRFPWTTGFGVGYRLTEWVNIRIEPKWHRFEFFYDSEASNTSNLITSYDVMSLGIGIYGHYQPFKRQMSFLKGIMFAPSLRFWPTIASSMKQDTYSYQNRNTGRTEEIKTLNAGVGFSPFIFNVSVGYTFGIKRKDS